MGLSSKLILEDVELEFNLVMKEFSRYLKKQLKTKQVIELCVKNMKQYMRWAYTEKNYKYLTKVNKNEMYRYEIFLNEIKKYKYNTIKQKIRIILIFNKFMDSFTAQHNMDGLFDESKICKRKKQYNYITKTYIKL
ncbi:hypothetical protein CLORY_31950 [Clostridium oryzae]|uniref:Core-binding (CB) domain-containing protein n=2 Tax=Clostridium oryzae TaxID=1450648 RepID=A0A1V4II18_9CLOT|nr:hypothetical protein CLORY_31950 [Clostridium oryzae]